MSMKLKALGLGLLAAMAMSAVAVINASATVSGHFVADEAHALVVGSENNTHKVKLSVDGGTKIECEEASYSGTTTKATETSLTITPTYHKCKTEGGVAGEVTVTMNGCDYTFFSNSVTHGTVTVDCPAGKTIEIHHPNCLIRIPAQTPTGGVTYTTTTENNKHALTANVTASNITAHYESTNGEFKACQFLGTTHTGTMSGSATIRGTNTDGEAIGITST